MTLCKGVGPNINYWIEKCFAISWISSERHLSKNLMQHLLQTDYMYNLTTMIIKYRYEKI